jgi:hypothetical protein
MSLPYYKRFPRDYLDGCVGMPFELRAGYGMILDLIYLKDGRLPLDKPWIAGHLGCSVRMVSKIIDGLIEAGKLVMSDNHVTNKRADKVIEETRKYRDKQAEIASLPRKNNDLPQPKPSQSESDTERKNPPTPKGEKVGLFDDQEFEQFWAAYPKRVAKVAARKAFLKAIAKTDLRTIIRAVETAKLTRDWAKNDGQFVPYPATWLNDGRWADDVGATIHPFLAPEPAHAYDPWPDRARSWIIDDGWNSVDWGPAPNKPGCRMDPRYIREQEALGVKWSHGIRMVAE